MSTKDKSKTIGINLETSIDSVKSDSIAELSGIRTRLDSAIVLGAQDPFGGISTAIATGSGIVELLNSGRVTLDTTPSGNVRFSDAISALGELTRPYDQLANIPSFQSYQSSVTNLAATSGMAATVSGLASARSNPLLEVNGNPVLSTPASVSAQLLVETVAGSLSRLTAASGSISLLSLTSVAGTLAGATLASTRAVLGIENAFAEWRRTDVAGIRIAEMPSYITTLHEGINRLTLSAKTSWDNLSHRPDLASGLSLYAARTPAVEIYSASHAAAVISLPVHQYPSLDIELEEIIDEAVEGLEARLSELEPALVEMYRGGLAALETGGSDWRRQTMVSFRELTTHVMHILAPDSDVKPWAKPEHLHNGKPTRKARLEFIFQSVASGEFVDFFKADVRASVELFDLLNQGTHRLSSKATPEQLKYLRNRVANLIDAMLEARGH
jgi:hypothetical protein